MKLHPKWTWDMERSSARMA